MKIDIGAGRGQGVLSLKGDCKWGQKNGGLHGSGTLIFENFEWEFSKKQACNVCNITTLNLIKILVSEASG